MRISRVFSAFVLAACIVPCVVSAQDKAVVYGIKGPSGIGMVKMFEGIPNVSAVSIGVEALGSADLMVARFATGEAKMGILPPNVAAKLYAAGKGISVAAVVGEGMLSLISADPSVKGIADLKGREVYVAGQGATPDLVFRKILTSKGLDPEKDLSLRYSMAYPEMAQALAAGRIDVAVLPEPFATLALKAKPALAVPVDIQAEWASAGGRARYPMTVFVVDAAYAAAKPDVVKAVLAAFKDSSAWVVAHPQEAGALVEKHDLGLKAAVAAAAIPKSAYTFVPAKDARKDLEALFGAFLALSPAAVGGKLPDDRFYY